MHESTPLQALACQELTDNLRIAKHRTLMDMFKALQDTGYCCDHGPEVMIHLGINVGNALPVPVLDVRTPEPEGWAGVHAYFFIGSGPERKCGHFIARNFAEPVPDGFTSDEYFEMVRQHEIYHVLQAMSGRDCDLMTADEMALCKGFVELLATVAAQGELSREHAFDLAGRWFLQRFKTELDAWQAVDFPRAAEKSKAGSLNLEEWRGDVLVTILRELFRPVCGGFVDAYRLNWRKLLASIRGRMKDIIAGTFLEEPVPFRSGSFTSLSCLESVRPRKGLLRNHGLDLGAFTQLTMLMPRVGQVGIYDLQQERAKKYLDGHPNPAPTLAGLEIRGLTNGCLLAERLPGCLQYDIVTHWLGNAPGTWEYEIVETAPDGERSKHTYPVTFKRRNDVTHAGIHKTTQFQRFGRYGVRILLEGAKLAETGFNLALAPAAKPLPTPCG